MELSKIIKNQKDFEEYLEFNEHYKKALFSFYKSYIEIFRWYWDRKKEFSIPSPSRWELMEALLLEEDIYFMWYKLNFN